MFKFKPKTLGGVQNEAPDVEKSKGSLIKADNVIIGDQGELIRRPAIGTTQFGGSVARDLFVPAHHDKMYVVEGMNLRAYDEGENLTTVAALTSNALVSYASVPNTDAIYASSATDLLQIHPDGSVHKPIPLPNVGSITLTVVPGFGYLPKGKYFVATAFRDLATGDTGGAVQIGSITLAEDDSAIVISPTVQSGATSFLRVYYCTTPNGEVLYESAAALGSAPTTLHDPADGKACDTLHQSPMLPGEFVEYVGGRLVTAKDNFITYSSAFKPLLTDAALNWISVTGKVRFMKRVGDVLFYGDDRGVMSVSNLGQESMLQREVTLDPPLYNSAVVLPNGTKLGSADKNNPADQPMIMWLGSRGAYVGMPNGLATKVHEYTQLDSNDVVQAANELVLRDVRHVVFAFSDHCMIVNSNTGGISHYPDLVISGVARFNNENWIASVTEGVRKLNYYSSLAPVEAAIEFGYSNFGADEEKRLDGVWLGLRSGRNLQLGLSVLGGSIPEQVYSIQSEATDELRNARFVPGKGMLGRYWKLRITDILGDFQIYSITLDIAKSKRRR